MKYSEAKDILEKQKAAQAIAERYEKLGRAHERYGFKSRKEFIQALQEVDRGGGRQVGKVRRAARRVAGKVGVAGRRGRGLSDEMVSKIKSLKAEGQSNIAISRATKISPLTVAKYVKGMKAPKKTAAAKKAPGRKAVRRGAGKGHAIPAATINRMKSLKASGKSNAEISRETNVSPMTVAKYVKAGGGEGRQK